MRLRFTQRATENLAAIAGYIRAHNPEAAKRVRASIYESPQNLILFPFAGRRQKTEGVQKLATRKYLFTLSTTPLTRMRKKWWS
jgi:toxin ParE1/3/4